jgi:hypothetical protein
MTLAVSRAALGALIAPNAIFGFAPLGSTTFVGTAMGSATSVTLPSVEFVNTVPATFNGVANSFAVAPNNLPVSFSPLDSVTMAPLTLNLPTISYGTPATPVWVPDAVSDFLVFGSSATPANRYSFDLTSWSATAASASATSLLLACTGVFHDAGGVFSDAPASLSFGFSGSNGSANVSASFAATPEPATLSLLALGGMMILPRRRRA